MTTTTAIQKFTTEDLGRAVTEIVNRMLEAQNDSISFEKALQARPLAHPLNHIIQHEVSSYMLDAMSNRQSYGESEAGAKGRFLQTIASHMEDGQLPKNTEALEVLDTVFDAIAPTCWKKSQILLQNGAASNPDLRPTREM